MELCEASLDQFFLEKDDPRKYNGPIVPPEQLVFQLACGLEYIHDMKLIHGNLKPENALVRVSQRRLFLKWSDAGLARPKIKEKVMHSDSGVRLTLKWCAPETKKMMRDFQMSKLQFQTGLSTQGDVFASGLVFGYIFLKGKHPYGDRYDPEYNIIESEPVGLKSNQRYN